MTLPEFPIVPTTPNLARTRLVMNEALLAWMKKAHTSEASLTNFLRACSVNPQNIYAKGDLLLLREATGATSEMLKSLQLGLTDFKIRVDGSVFLKQDFIRAHNENHFKISTMLIPRVATELERAKLFPFFIETIVFYGKTGHEKVFEKAIRDPRTGKLVHQAEARYEVDSQYKALNRHREILRILKKAAVAAAPRLTQRRALPIKVRKSKPRRLK